jgi:hypothetical protein
MYHHEHAIMVHASTYFHVDKLSHMQHASNYPSGSLNSSKDLLNVIAYLRNSSSNHTFDTHHLCDRLNTLYPTLANHFYHHFYSSDIIQPIPPHIFSMDGIQATGPNFTAIEHNVDNNTIHTSTPIIDTTSAMHYLPISEENIVNDNTSCTSPSPHISTLNDTITLYHELDEDHQQYLLIVTSPTMYPFLLLLL